MMLTNEEMAEEIKDLIDQLNEFDDDERIPNAKRQRIEQIINKSL